MASINAFAPQELTDAELANVQGGGLGSWLRKNLIEPIQSLFRGGNPPPPAPYDPQNPFGSDPRLKDPVRPF